MGYLVLARKWRPQTFEEVIGQDHVVQGLENTIRNSRVAHALLFTGSRGVGKTSVARILTKALECEHGPTVAPCNECSICREISSGSAVDVYEIDGASNRGIDEIRELRESIKYLPVKSRYKIYIIDEVHMLTSEAFNALLKTLEEPPEHVVFIFATTEPHKIPLTILSRCQRYDFKRLSIQDIIGQLQLITKRENIRIDERILQFIAREAAGGMRDALSLLDRIISYDGIETGTESVAALLGFADKQSVFQLTRALLEHDLSSGIEILNQAYMYGYDIKRLYSEFVETVRNLILLKICRQPAELMSLADDERAELATIGGEKTFETLYQHLHLLMQGWDELRKSSYPKLAFEMILMRASLLKDITPIEMILKSLSNFNDASETKLQNEEEERVRPEKAENNLGLQEFFGFLKKKSPSLAAILKQYRDIALKDGILEITFESNSFCDLLQDTDYNRRLHEICREYFQKHINIKITSDPVRYGFVKEHASSAKEELLKNSLVQDTIDIFDGQIDEIKIDKLS